MFDPEQFKLIADTHYITQDSRTKRRLSRAEQRSIDVRREKAAGRQPLHANTKIVAILEELKVRECAMFERSREFLSQLIYNSKHGVHFPEMRELVFTVKRTSSTTCMVTRIA